MQSRARFLGHSIHQSLVAFPVGLLATAVILDLIAHEGTNLDVPSSLDGVPAESALHDEPPTASVRR